VSVIVDIKTDIEAVKRANQQLVRSFGRVAQEVSSMSALMLADFLGVDEALQSLVGTFKGWVSDSQEATLQLEEWGRVTGTAVSELDGLYQTIGQGRLEIADFAQVLTDVSEKVIENTDDYKRFGIEFRDANGNIKTSSEIFLAVGDRITQATTTSEKMAIAMTLMGDEAQRLVPAFDQGTDAIRRQMIELEEAGLLTSTYQAELARLSQESIQNMGNAASALSRNFNEAVGPYIVALRESIADVLTDMARWFKANRQLIDSGIQDFLSWMANTGIPTVGKGLERLSLTYYAMIDAGLQSQKLLHQIAQSVSISGAAYRSVSIQIANIDRQIIDNQKAGFEASKGWQQMTAYAVDKTKEYSDNVTRTKKAIEARTVAAQKEVDALKGNRSQVLDSEIAAKEAAKAAAARRKAMSEERRALSEKKAMYNQVHSDISRQMQRTAVYAQQAFQGVSDAVPAMFEGGANAAAVLAKSTISTLNNMLQTYVQQWVQSQIAIAAAERARVVSQYPAEASMVAVKASSAVAATPIIGPALAVGTFASILASMLSMAVGFNSGGLVGGRRGRDEDSVFAALTPGEFVIPRSLTNELIHSSRVGRKSEPQIDQGHRGNSSNKDASQLVLNIVGMDSQISSARLADKIETAIKENQRRGNVLSGRRVF
jgi:hypothetical protein